MTTIIQALRDYFLGCPALADNRINVNYLPESALNGVEVSIDATPIETVVRPYKNGGGLEQYAFTLRTVNEYSEGFLQNIDNSGLFEAIAVWLRTQSKARSLPELPEGLTPIRIAAQSSGYLFSAEAAVAKYQIQCNLFYYRKGA